VSRKPGLPEEAVRTFRAGALVRWNPPEGAYSPRCLQQQLAGQTGVVQHYDEGRDTLPVRIDRLTLFLNSAYLEAV